MTDQHEGDPSQSPAPGASPSRDGLIDFTHYSDSQLRELEFTIDRTAYPLNFNNLLQELARRAAMQQKPAHAQSAFAARFTRRDGWLGWLQAKAKFRSLYGAGTVQLRPGEIALQGWQRTWLGVAMQAERIFPLDGLRNAARFGSCVRLQFREPQSLPRQFEVEMESVEQAESLVAQLPQTESSRRTRQWLELREFNQMARTLTPNTWITTLIVAANVVVFVTMCIAAGQPGVDFDLQHLLRWGANFGPLTVNGQWWRLLLALFLHGSLAHLLLNLWALWNAGRLVERLYGRWAYLFIYLASGTFASLGSIAWNPANASVGASGAIFGVLGAFLAFLANRTSRVPTAMVRVHWLSTLAFVLFNLISGAMQPTIDNAAHVFGLLSGLIFGWILARPLEPESRETFPAIKVAGAAVVLLAGMLAALWQVRGIGSQLTAPEEYLRTHEWYVNGESGNLRLWQDLANGAGSGTISDAVMALRFERDIVPFWKSAEARLRKELGSLPPEQKPYGTLVADFARSRLDWARAVIDATKNQDQARGGDALRLFGETSLIQAKLDRVAMRSALAHRPRALVSSAPARKIRALFTTATSWKCVEDEDPYGPNVSPKDSRADGPALRQEAACRAQRLFMSGDYPALDALMKAAVKAGNDLPDGRSTLDALYGGLWTLFDQGTFSLPDALARMSDWRREVPDSIDAELVEAQLFEAWAWSARGHGSVSTVSRQAWAAFAYRSEMAAEALREIAPRAVAHPQWYLMQLDVGLDQSLEKQELRKRFDAGAAKFPQNWQLYTRMLRILMPRWGGSHEEVDAFIREMSWEAGKPDRMATYARLYWIYSVLERDDTVIFGGDLADWSEMKSGFSDLVRRHPRSDFVLNAFANFACRSGDVDEYRRLRPTVGTRFSTVAWSAKWTVKVCDDKFSRGEMQAPLSSSRDAQAMLAKDAQAAFEREDWGAARAAGQEMIDANPSDVGGYLLAASADAAANRYDQARTLYRKAASIAPENGQIWQSLADAEMHSQNYSGALDALNHAMQADPELWSALTDRAVIQDALGHRAKAMEDARTACRNGESMACKMVRDWEP